MTSIAAVEVYDGGSGYTSAKHAEGALHRTLRGEYLGSPVRFTEILPGMVETDFSLIRFDGDADKAAAVYKGLTPLVAQDIAEVVAFAVSRPAHVNLDSIVIKPRAQASASRAFRDRARSRPTRARAATGHRTRPIPRRRHPWPVPTGRRCAAPVGQRQDVLAGQCHPAARSLMALVETGPLDQPRGGELRGAGAGRVRRHPLVDAQSGEHGGQFVVGQHRIGEERAGAPGVPVGRVEQHSLAPPQFQHRGPGVGHRHPGATGHAEQVASSPNRIGAERPPSASTNRTRSTTAESAPLRMLVR